MGYRRDLTGMVFGDFTVLGHDESRGKYQYYEICKCNKCGKEKSIASGGLTTRNKNFCECNEKFNKREDITGYEKDLSGEKFGSLTVISFSHTEHSHSHWNCVCDCGEDVTKSISYLKGSKYKMCNKCRSKILSDKIVKKEKPVVDKKSPGQKKQNTYCEMGDYTIINGDIIVDTEDVEFIKSLNRYVSKSSGGYPLIFVNNGWFFIHRLLMGLPQKYDKETKIIVDHINGNRLDCRKQNMRICHKEKNPINCKTYKSNTSGVKGVSWMKKLSKYQASICVNGKSIYLGVHSDINDAIAARKEAENKYFGEFNRGGVNE
jgi:hypothetical protein